MNFTLDIMEMLQVGVVVVGVVVWLMRGRNQGATVDATLATKLEAQGFEIRDLKSRLSELSESHQLVARLEERIKGVTDQLAQQPQVIGAAIREALSAVLAGARRTP